MTAQVAILIPVVDRPDRVIPVRDSIAATTKTDHRVIFIASPGETAEISALKKAGVEFVVAPFPRTDGDYARKINYGLTITEEPWIFTGADDLCFHPQWDRRAFARRTRDAGVIGTNDLGNPRVIAGSHSTHSLVSREYAMTQGLIDRPGQIYYEGYPHEYCDDELIATAKIRRAFVFAVNSHVEHLHPHWGKGIRGLVYDETGDRLERGRQIFEVRRRMWHIPPNVGQHPLAPRARARDVATVSVVVATFGDERWSALARERALPSIDAQTHRPVDVIVEHGPTLALARNVAGLRARGDIIVFLDADDELARGYVAAIAYEGSRGDLLVPSVQQIKRGRERPARQIPARPLRSGNFMVIGTGVRREIFEQTGGFGEYRAWEDWALWLRCVALGARIHRVPRAVYRAHESPDGRNNTVDDGDGLRDEILTGFDRWCDLRKIPKEQRP